MSFVTPYHYPICLLVLAFSLFLASCGESTPPAEPISPLPPQVTDDVDTPISSTPMSPLQHAAENLAAANNRFGFALQITYNGAAGETDEEMARVLHKAVVKVNEEGTEAAAVAVVGMAVSEPLSFIVNRSFFFAIHDSQTDAILFLGALYQPELLD